ncbi:MAG: hypothetical protein DRP09_13475 [Candidatus Thorarchaeota archaeon]|nr:MAG: hypothetical protein DRP09_13475 [Candidatus Thorarchaeota archaeon]
MTENYRIMNTAVWDVETKRITESPYDAELSSISIIFSDTGKFHFFTGDDNELREGVELLLKAKRQCTFNGKRFDVPVILKYMTRGEGKKLRAMPHLDFYHEFVRQNPGRRISLKNMTYSTLGNWNMKFDLYDQSAVSLYYVRPEKLEAYNNWDTRVTYWLLLALYKLGYVKYTLPTLQKLYIPNWGPQN